jgi:hypothetical protein
MNPTFSSAECDERQGKYNCKESPRTSPSPDPVGNLVVETTHTTQQSKILEVNSSTDVDDDIEFDEDELIVTPEMALALHAILNDAEKFYSRLKITNTIENENGVRWSPEISAEALDPGSPATAGACVEICLPQEESVQSIGILEASQTVSKVRSSTSNF